MCVCMSVCSGSDGELVSLLLTEGQTPTKPALVNTGPPAGGFSELHPDPNSLSQVSEGPAGRKSQKGPKFCKEVVKSFSGEG